MLTKFRKSEKGFTLIELLIVVAIIGILAAIAIPQFSAYRIRGYNAAANADLRNSRTTMEAFFSDWQVYPSTGANAAPTVTAVYTNLSGVINIPLGTMVALIAPSAATNVQFPVSAGVGLVVKTSAGGGSFSMATKNLAGDRCYGGDSDTSQLMWVNGVLAQGMAVLGAPDAVSGADDFATVLGGAPCNGSPAGTGQLTWVPLS